MKVGEKHVTTPRPFASTFQTGPDHTWPPSGHERGLPAGHLLPSATGGWSPHALLPMRWRQAHHMPALPQITSLMPGEMTLRSTLRKSVSPPRRKVPAVTSGQSHLRQVH